jgi:hypothetical protein
MLISKTQLKFMSTNFLTNFHLIMFHISFGYKYFLLTEFVNAFLLYLFI